jgi:hypothetical protein
MRVGVIQSNYIPWRGYFDFIAQVDLFIFHDDLQYTKGDWRNRNRIKSPAGPIWLTVPVKHKSTSQLICDTEIDYATQWQRDHLNKFAANYAKTPHYRAAAELLESAFPHKDRTISELNVRLIRAICGYLGITTKLRHSAEYSPAGSKTARLIDLLRKAGASAYLSGPAAKSYLEEQQFRESGIRLEYKSYDYAPYPQLWGGFEGSVSILDLIANVGSAAKEWLSSRSPNDLAAA